MAAIDADTVVRLLGLERLPPEGGLFRRVHGDAYSSAIYYLLADGDFSALHRLPGVEVYHHYAGAPARLLVLGPGGRVDEPLLGDDLAAGHRPLVVVPGGTWQGGASLGSWTLLGTTMAPGYRDDDFELGERAALTAGWPAAAERIAALTRA